jgi:hypothetical protein
LEAKHSDDARVVGVEVDDELEKGPERVGAELELERNEERDELGREKLARETGENGARLVDVAGLVLGANDGKDHVDVLSWPPQS